MSIFHYSIIHLNLLYINPPLYLYPSIYYKLYYLFYFSLYLLPIINSIFLPLHSISFSLLFLDNPILSYLSHLVFSLYLQYSFNLQELKILIPIILIHFLLLFEDQSFICYWFNHFIKVLIKWNLIIRS